MRMLITGGLGSLGQALARALGAEHELHLYDLPEMDITEPASVAAAMAAVQPELVIHCAAYTNVDGCARDPELAFRVNAYGSQNMALACAEHDIPLVHISSNEVFGGTEPNGYREWQPMAPVNPYGESKVAAEFMVRSAWRKHYIVRFSWLFAPGGRNFIHAILGRARETGSLRVVTDEVANPTYSEDLAEAIGQLVLTGRFGTYHLPNEGHCSRWGFAQEILRQAGLDHVRNDPILLKEFKRDSTPPHYAALQNNAAANLGIRLRTWQAALADYLKNHPDPTGP